MTRSNSTARVPTRTVSRKKKPGKPKKPHKDFPLYAHPNGQWCKKVRQKKHYFGTWVHDPKGERALERWLAEKDSLLAGRVPRQTPKVEASQTALHHLVNSFLTWKGQLRDSGELSPHTLEAYHNICAELIGAFGRDRLLSDISLKDFEDLRIAWSKRWGPVRLGNEINRARVVFKYGYKQDLIEKEMKFGEGFRRPSKKVLRLNRAAAGVKMFTAKELRAMLDKAGCRRVTLADGTRQEFPTPGLPLKAMLLLGANGGLGNNDIALLPMRALDLDGGWLNYPRPKTGLNRRVPLWQETITAIREWLKRRPTPKNEADAELVFLTARGESWAKNVKDRPITHECRKLLDWCEIGGSRNFYALRHTFETIGGESRDQIAVDAIMGHADGRISDEYREGISDERLRAVVEHVRNWLLADPNSGKDKTPQLNVGAPDDKERAGGAKSRTATSSESHFLMEIVAGDDRLS